MSTRLYVATAQRCFGIRMQIRIASTDDRFDIAEIYAPIVEQTHISFEIIPPDASEMANRIAAALENHVWLVAEEAGRINGYAHASKYRGKPAYEWSTETTIYVRDAVRGKGIGRSLYGALLPILTAQNYRRAFAGIALPNAGSVALHEAAGFKYIGTNPEAGFKFDRWHDLGWWSFQLNNREGRPEPIIPLQKLGDLKRFIS
jgi:L-amino acid N-acyltransferase YncA